MRKESSPLQPRHRGSGKSEMMRHDAAVVGEELSAINIAGGGITVLYGTYVEGIAHHHPPMLVTSVKRTCGIK